MAGFFTWKTFDFRVLSTLVKIFLLLIVRGSLTYSAQSDIDCLRAIKDSLEDQNGYLTTWNFDNKTEGFICSFIGIECWHPDENKVLNIKLGDMELKGEFPLGVAGCSSLTGATSAAFAVGIGIGVGMFFYLGKASRKKKEEDPMGNKWAKRIKDAKAIKLSMFENSVSEMKLSDLMKVTNDFSKENIIGFGRTGTMYKAVLKDGSCLIVKRLQGTRYSNSEFSSEMATLANVKHNNLVPLLGFCMTNEERLVVYRHMSNGSLHDKLHLKDGTEPMDWPLRLKIGIGVAKGLAWLHHSCNPRIIHRNISSNCILLHDNYEPKILDSGIACLVNPIVSHLGTCVNGEFGDRGYVAPEYVRTLLATPKGDVYSFGVVLLELVTGERPTNVAKAPERLNGNIVAWIFHLSGTYKLQDAIDQFLVGKGYDNELFEVLNVACSCVLTDPKERPSMSEVYQFLRAIGQKYNFAAEDDILLPSNSGDDDQLVELIIAQHPEEIDVKM